ncbi:MAG: class I SAM-dependent methyltransferase [Gammaproteobacteria bacterium]|nr:class I SAM-dependent methyltransferase [Gammaproteobacteria bacterium]
MTEERRHIEQWDRYWSYGNIHSFSQVSEGNYRGAIADFWRTRCERLPGSGRFLDVATGNGAVALLVLETGDRLAGGLEVHGVDLADIAPGSRVSDPELAKSLGRIRFRGRTAVESLPYDSASFDMVGSQFGVEYSDLSRSIPEISRVLKPGGGFSAIMHHHDSVLLRSTREELAQLDFVLDEVKLYLRARNLLREMADGGRGTAGRGGKPSPKLEKKRRALGDAMERIKKAANASNTPNMLLGPARYVHEIFGALDRMPAKDLLDWLDEARSRVTANRQRLLDMIRAARKESDLDDLRQWLTTAGFPDLELAPFYQDDGALLGWRLDAGKETERTPGS